MPSFFHKSTNSLPYPFTTLGLASAFVNRECRCKRVQPMRKEEKTMAKEIWNLTRNPYAVFKCCSKRPVFSTEKVE
ncbi:hypothetical protein PAJ34TS1_03670 [Paenibacillus azoreducens]